MPYRILRAPALSSVAFQLAPWTALLNSLRVAALTNFYGSSNGYLHEPLGADNTFGILPTTAESRLKIKIQTEHEIVYIVIVGTRHVIVEPVFVVIHPVVKALFAKKDSFITTM